MSMDHERNEKPITEEEGGMFAAQPIWERRGNKRRGFGGRKTAAPAPTVAPEPRTFAAERDYDEPMALDTPIDPQTGDDPRARYDEMRPAATAAMATTPPAAEPASDSGLVAPIGRSASRADRGPRSKGVGPAAIAAGVVALGAIGAVGWYATRDNDGIPELAPGQATESQVATAPLPPVDLPPNNPALPERAGATTAAATPPRATVRAAAPARAERRMASANRTRPAAASAGDTGVNASATATLPAGPQPYSTLNPGAAPPPPVNTPAPATAAPPPAESPAQIPATPPTLPTETTPPTATPEAPEPPM